MLLVKSNSTFQKGQLEESFTFDGQNFAVPFSKTAKLNVLIDSMVRETFNQQQVKKLQIVYEIRDILINMLNCKVDLGMVKKMMSQVKKIFLKVKIYEQYILYMNKILNIQEDLQIFQQDFANYQQIEFKRDDQLQFLKIIQQTKPQIKQQQTPLVSPRIQVNFCEELKQIITNDGDFLKNKSQTTMNTSNTFNQFLNSSDKIGDFGQFDLNTPRKNTNYSDNWEEEQISMHLNSSRCVTQQKISYKSKKNQKINVMLNNIKKENQEDEEEKKVAIERTEQNKQTKQLINGNSFVLCTKPVTKIPQEKKKQTKKYQTSQQINRQIKLNAKKISLRTKTCQSEAGKELDSSSFSFKQVKKAPRDRRMSQNLDNRELQNLKMSMSISTSTNHKPTLSKKMSLI